MDLIKKVVKNRLWPIVVMWKLVLNRESFLHATGWIESIRRGYPCRPGGAEVPWMNHGIITFLEDRLTDEIRVFEYGSGYSTSFYARLVASIKSVEYDRKWYELISKTIPDNASLMFVNRDVDGAYCRAILKGEELYDVVIVDGRDRVNCVIQSIDALSDHGVIILDDSHRERYRAATDYAISKGFRILGFEGLKQTGYILDKCTVMYRDNNCLGL